MSTALRLMVMVILAGNQFFLVRHWTLLNESRVERRHATDEEQVTLFVFGIVTLILWGVSWHL